MSQDDAKKDAGRQGGLKRAEALSDERKKEIAQTAALRRWGAKATHKGNFEKDFGIDVDCYVLNDLPKTAVISQRGMGEALGLSKGGGSRLPRFVGNKAITPYIGPELRQKLEKPLIFQMPPAGPNTPPQATVYGYDVAILIDLCRAIIQAESDGNLLKRHANVARQAHVIIAASAKAGIKGLVYALSGYDATKEEVIQAFRLYVLEEAKKYEPEFPNELYDQWYRLYQISLLQRGKPWQFKHLTVNHIYWPLAKSNGKILELVRALKAKHGDQKTKLFQFLNDIGARALRIQIGRVLEMSESSVSKTEYEGKVALRFGGQQQFDFTTEQGQMPVST